MAQYGGGDQYYGAGGRRTDEFGNPVCPQTDEWGNPVRSQTDEWGNPINRPRTDEWGNPVHHGGGVGGDTMGEFYSNTTAPTGPAGGVTGTGTGTTYVTTETVGVLRPHDVATGGVGKEQHGTLGGMLRRSGSSSSSSSEDDGQGGRRKKGIKEKIKEKLPGGGGDRAHRTTAGQDYAHHPAGQDYAHRPTAATATHASDYGAGDYRHHQNQPTAATTTPSAQAGYGYGGEGEHHEKKGFMDKIKEKLPGHH